MTNICKVESLTNRVEEIARKLRPVQAETGGWGNALRGIFQPDPVKVLKQHIVERSASLQEQLGGIKTIIVFDNTRTAPLSGWQARTDSGRVSLKKIQAKPASLHLTATEAASAGAWWTTVWLEEGRYQVTGRVRVQGVAATAALEDSGAGFRVFSHRKLSAGLVWDWFPYRESHDLEKRGEMAADNAKANNKRLSGNTDWVELTYDFDLRQPAADLEISCELRADQGEAWFDVDSLKIVRK